MATSPTSASPTTSTHNWAFFSIRGDGSINARTNVGGAQQDTQLPSALIGSAHNYRIEWDATEVRYYVDGSLVVTHSANFGSTQMRPAASDFNAGGSDVAVDWLHMSPYPGAGSFTSRVLDAGQSADWGPLSWIANTPAGTSVVLNVRTGNTATPDGSWSSFTPINANGGDIPGNSRYLQYRADLSSTDQGTTPALSQVTASYNAGADTTPPTIVGRLPLANATGVAPDTDVLAQFSEPMDPSTINSSTIRLREQGAGTDVPAAVTYTGNTATLDPNADLDPNAVYNVTVAGTVTDSNGNPLGADDTWNFTTAPHVFDLTDTSSADFGAGTPDANTYVSQTGDGEVTLNPTVGEEFSGGPALPAGWSSGTWESQGGGSGGTATLSGGSLHVDGAFAKTTATYGSGRYARVRGELRRRELRSTSALVSTSTTARLGDVLDQGRRQHLRPHQHGRSQTETQLQSALIGSAHDYRIEWDATAVRYYVDGSLVATHAANFGATQMEPIASDFTAGGPGVSVDWLHMSPYPGSGSFTSRVLDAGQSAAWGALSWAADTPAGTSVALSVRTGNTRPRTGAGARSPRSPPMAVISPAIRAICSTRPI